MNIFTSILYSIQLYLELKNKLYYYEISQKSRDRQKELISQIEDLRSNGDSNSADFADLLRKELASEKNEFKLISTIYSSASKGDPNSDS